MKRYRRFPLSNNRGGALIAVIVISLLVLSLTMWLIQWTSIRTKEEVHSRGIQNALGYAESGAEAAQDYIRYPGTVISTSPYEASEDVTNGRIAYSVTPTQKGGLEAYATGYYYAPQGSFEDPLTHRRCQIAVVRSLFHYGPIDKAMIVAPGHLKISRGTQATGIIYANDVVFVNGPDSAEKASVSDVFYGTSMKRDDGTSDTSPSYVVFMSTPHQAGFPMRFPRLTPAIRSYYLNLSTSSMSQLSDGTAWEGEIPAPPDNPVYFCDGDLHVGRTGPVSVAGSLIVYVTGQLTLHNEINVAGPYWIVFLVEKDIVIDNTGVNDNFNLKGTYVTNGKITSTQRHRPGNLSVTGSLIAAGGIDLASGWDNQRTYSHRRAFPTVPLPRGTQTHKYEIIQGKYQ